MRVMKIEMAKLDQVRPPAGADPLEDLFTGTVSVEVPGFDERQKIRMELVPPAVEQGDEDFSEKWNEYRSKLLERARKQIQTVELKVRNSGEAISSLEDLEYYEDGIRLLEAVAFLSARGVPLGNSRGEPSDSKSAKSKED